MTKYFAGNSLAAFQRSDTNSVEDTTAGRFDSTYVSHSIKVNTGYIETPAFNATGTVWLRWSGYMSYSGSAVNQGPSLWNGSTGIVRITTQSGYVQQVQYWNGSAWTNTGNTWPMTSNYLAVYVMKVTLGSGYELYKNGVLISSGSGWTGSPTTATNMRFYPHAGGNSSYISEVIIADYNLMDSHFKVPALNGNSATNTGGTGSYTDVNETVLSDATTISVSAIGNKMGQTHAALSLGATQKISAVVVSARANVDGTTITNSKLGIRTAGSVNDSGSNLNPGTSFGPIQRIIETDPDTTAAWTLSNFNSTEIYEEAV